MHDFTTYQLGLYTLGAAVVGALIGASAVFVWAERTLEKLEKTLRRKNALIGQLDNKRIIEVNDLVQTYKKTNVVPVPDHHERKD